MEAALTSPSGKTELCEIRDLAEHLYDIKFVPEEEGVHTVSLKYKGLHISGGYTTDRRMRQSVKACYYRNFFVPINIL